MADAENADDFVTFLDSNGEEISNDPRWRAQKTLEARGINPNAAAEKDDIIAQLEEQLRALQAQGIAPNDDEDELTDEDGFAVDEEGKRTYTDLDSKAVVAELKKREIPLTKEDGTKLKVGEARAALVADDAAKADQE